MSVKTFREGIKLDPQSADPTATEGQLQYSDGTARDEGLYVYQNGAWALIGLQNDTDWASATMTIKGATSDPTKGTTGIDQLVWRRNGPNMEMLWTYTQTGAGSAGSGAYKFLIPDSQSIDTSLITASTSGVATVVGHGLVQHGDNDAFSVTCYPCHWYAYDSTHLGCTFWSQSGGAVQTNRIAMASGTNGNLSTASLMFTMQVSVPISGWTV